MWLLSVSVAICQHVSVTKCIEYYYFDVYHTTDTISDICLEKVVYYYHYQIFEASTSANVKFADPEARHSPACPDTGAGRPYSPFCWVVVVVVEWRRRWG